MLLTTTANFYTNTALSAEDEYGTNVPIFIQLDDKRSFTIDQNGGCQYEGYTTQATSINESCFIDKQYIIAKNKSKRKTRRRRNNERTSSIIIKESVQRWNPKMFCDQMLASDSNRRTVQSAGARWKKSPQFQKKGGESNTSKSLIYNQDLPKEKSKVKKKEQSSQYLSDCRATVSNARQMNQVERLKKKNNLDSSTRLHITLPGKSSSRCPPLQTPNLSRPANVSWVLSLHNIASSVFNELSTLKSREVGKGYEKNIMNSKGPNQPFLPLKLDKGLFESKCLLGQDDSSSVVLKKLQSKESAQHEERHKSLQTSNLSETSYTVPKRSSKKKTKSSISKIGGAPLKPGMVNKKYTFQPTACSLSTLDQNELVSTRSKGTRMGNKSSSTSPRNSSVITSSFLQNSQLLNVQKIAKSQRRMTKEANNYSNLLKEESHEVTFEENKLQNILDRLSKMLYTNDAVSSKDRKPKITELGREDIYKKIRELEIVVRNKLKQLQIIQWKKLKARDEEILLNKRLESILKKIRDIRQSDSLARVIDKQTQVFASKVPKSNVIVTPFRSE